MQLTTYLNNKKAHALATLTIDVNGKSYRSYEGNIYSEKEFKKVFPIDVHKIEFANCYLKGKNPNERKLLTF